MNLIEPLEGRVFFTATPEKFNLFNLLGYNLAGASYKYRTTATFDDGDPADASSEVISTKQTIGTKKQTYDAHAATVAKLAASSPATSITGAWFNSSSTGTLLLFRNLIGEDFTLTEKLHDTRIGPASMTTGTKYTDTGTADGSLTFPVQGQTVNGTFTGTSSVSAKIVGRESVTVRGKTYSTAVKGTFTIVLSGNIKAKYLGVSITVPTKFTETQTFWAKPGLGAVRMQDTFVINLSPPGQSALKATIAANSDLVSYVLPT